MNVGRAGMLAGGQDFVDVSKGARLMRTGRPGEGYGHRGRKDHCAPSHAA
jgi:hypothetical protein